MKMRRARRRPNIAKLSGFKGADVATALGSKGLRDFSKNTATSQQPIDSKNLTEQQKVTLRAAGYSVPD